MSDFYNKRQVLHFTIRLIYSVTNLVGCSLIAKIAGISDYESFLWNSKKDNWRKTLNIFLIVAVCCVSYHKFSRSLSNNVIYAADIVARLNIVFSVDKTLFKRHLKKNVWLCTQSAKQKMDFDFITWLKTLQKA